MLAPERTTTRPALDTPPPRIFTLRGSALDEMTRARSVYEEATRFVAQAMESARVEGQLDLRGGAELIERMTESIGRNSGALLSLCKVQDPARYHHLHSVSVCALTIALSHALGDTLQQTHEIGLGGLLHDIGMALVPDRILEKPGKLTEREYAEVRRHPAISFKLLDAVPGVSATMLRMALDHHERLDGSGYPRKLAGDAISREGRIAAVCDVYDAMTAQRRWNRATPPSRALRTLLEFSDRHFCKETVQAFIRAIGVYPAGSLVRLESERLAIVLEQSPGAPLEPLVRIVYDAKRDRYLPPEDLDLHGKPSDRDPIVKYEDPLKWGIDTRRFI